MDRKALAQHLRVARNYRRKGDRFQAGLWLGMALGILGEDGDFANYSRTARQVDSIASYFYGGRQPVGG